MSEPWFGKSMFEPWVWELCVRTLGSGTLCSNPEFGNSIFEPWVEPRVPWVQPKFEICLFPPPNPPSTSSNPGFKHPAKTSAHGRN